VVTTILVRRLPNIIGVPLDQAEIDIENWLRVVRIAPGAGMLVSVACRENRRAQIVTRR